MHTESQSRKLSTNGNLKEDKGFTNKLPIALYVALDG